MIYIRSTLANIGVYGCLLFGCVVSSAMGLISRKSTIYFWNYFMIPVTMFVLRLTAGIKIEIRGRQHLCQDGVIYASKHESALETYCMSMFIKKAVFILKKELTYIPIFGWAQHFYGMIPVNRAAGGSAMKAMMKEAKDRMNKGRPIIIFPEGTRCKPGTTKGYKPGLLFIAEQLKAPVIPVALNTGLFWAKNSFLRYPGKVIIEFMEPMPEIADKKEFMAELEKRIEGKCTELNAETLKNYPYTKVNLG